MLWGFEGFGELFSLEKFPKRIPATPQFISKKTEKAAAFSVFI